MEREAKLNAWIMIGLPALASLTALTMPLFGGPEKFLISIMLFVGGYLVLHSKLKLKMRTRKLVEWGSGGMTRKEKVRYFIGYLFLILAVGFIASIYFRAYWR
ncbi:hypothetical protein [Bdellovibrio sp. HCB-162]|uniref:hypothetical protein n=1 Tax=Bdellovibrio sp. HCB-162 TaxID=3394234 RepID=UPI0039BD463F